jgi:hypothetical protein
MEGGKGGGGGESEWANVGMEKLKPAGESPPDDGCEDV